MPVDLYSKIANKGTQLVKNRQKRANVIKVQPLIEKSEIPSMQLLYTDLLDFLLCMDCKIDNHGHGSKIYFVKEGRSLDMFFEKM